MSKTKKEKQIKIVLDSLAGNLLANGDNETI